MCSGVLRGVFWSAEGCVLEYRGVCSGVLRGVFWSAEGCVLEC